MNISIIGTGYVGLSTGVCLAEIGHDVVCIDTDQKKIALLKSGISPIYEPGMDELLEKNIAAKRLSFTNSHQEGLAQAEIIIIAVGTPQKEDGCADLSYLETAVADIAANLSHDAVVIIKSTVPVGTNDRVRQMLQQLLPDHVKVDVVSNPEFLRQGSAIRDTLEADRIVIGAENEAAALKVKEMYAPLNVPVLITSNRSAEMIKYASNSFLATKISFINEIANLCEAAGADVLAVAKGMGYDKRIGSHFLNAGIGYGGSCFPKDVKALLHTAKQFGREFALLKETVAVNESQRTLLVDKVLARFGNVAGLRFAMLGLAFKPETDDMREAPSIPISRRLAELGAVVVAYDPVALENGKRVIGDRIQYANSLSEAVQDADALLIVTEWDEIKNMDLEKLAAQKNPLIIFDGRNCLDEAKIAALPAVEYYPVGRPAIIKGK